MTARPGVGEDWGVKGSEYTGAWPELEHLARDPKWSPPDPDATYAVQRDAREGLCEVKGRDLAAFFRAALPSLRVRGLWPGCRCWGCA